MPTFFYHPWDTIYSTTTTARRNNTTEGKNGKTVRETELHTFSSVNRSVLSSGEDSVKLTDKLSVYGPLYISATYWYGYIIF